MHAPMIKLLQAPAVYTLLGRAIQYTAQVALVLLVPKLLPPDLYVQFSLVLPLAYLGASVVFGWLTSAAYRHVHQLLQAGDDRYRQTAFAYYAAVSVALAASFFAAAALSPSIYRVIPLLLVAAGLKTGVLAILNSAERHKDFLVANLGFAFTLALFLALCYADGNLVLNLALYAGADVAVAVIAWTQAGIFSLRALPRFDAGIALRYFRYGLPLMANMIATWTISLSDRYLLLIWESTERVAGYILSYQLGGSVVTVPMSFAMAVLFPRIIKLDREAGERAALDYTHGLMKVYLRLMTAGVVLGCAVVIPFMYFFYPGYEFEPAVIVLIVLAHAVFGLTHFFNKEFELNGRTMTITKGVGLGAVMNVALNLVLMPLLGTLGAALATLIAYCVAVLYIYRSRRYAPNAA